MNNRTSMESSRRDLVIDMAVDKFIFNKRVRSPRFLSLYSKQVWDYLKLVLVFMVYLNIIHHNLTYVVPTNFNQAYLL